jgi:hypothetical protein
MPAWRTLIYFALCTLLLALPALINGYPFLYPDSTAYFWSGESFARSLLGAPYPQFGPRSELYSLFLFALSFRVSLWPLVFAAVLAIVWTIYLVFRMVQPHSTRTTRFLVMLGLAVGTSLAWRASQILPDALTGLMPLWIFLVGVVPHKLSGRELGVVTFMLWLGTVAHPTHLVILIVLGLPVLLFPLPKKPMGLKLLLGVLVLAVGGQVLSHWFLYKRANLFGNPHPFLLARICADGPGQRFLSDDTSFTVSKYSDLIMNKTADQILWEPGSFCDRVQKEHPEDFEKIRAEEKAFVFAVVRRYPLEQLRASFKNFSTQATRIGLMEGYHDHYVVRRFLEASFPGDMATYQQTLQARNLVPVVTLTTVVTRVFWVSLFIGLLGLILRWQHLDSTAKWLLGLGVLGILTNAALTGVLSGVHDRYQCRIAWTLPLLVYFILTYRAQENQN